MLHESRDATRHQAGVDARREGRRKLETEAVVRDTLHVRIGGEVMDISEHGCRIALHAGSARPGQFITIKLAGFESWSGVVRWSDKTQIGVEFARGLHQAVVDHLASTHAVVAIS